MARVRQLSPAFWMDEDMAQVCPMARLLFLGLLGLADRDGRVEDRPAYIRVQVFSYDSLESDGYSINAMLDELARDRQRSPGGFIIRYRIGGRDYIQIRNFTKYQHPHPKEVPSKIPQYQEGTEKPREGTTLPGNAAGDHGEDVTDRAVPSVPSVPSGSSVPSDAGVLRSAQPASEPTRLDLEREYFQLVRAVAEKQGRYPDDVAAEVGTWNGRRQINPANMGLERLRNTLIDLRQMLNGQPVRAGPPEPPGTKHGLPDKGPWESPEGS